MANTIKVTAWKPKGLSHESIEPPSNSDNSHNPGIDYFDNSEIRVRFDGHCLKQEKVTFTHKQVINISILYEIFDIYEKFVTVCCCSRFYFRKIFVWNC